MKVGYKVWLHNGGKAFGDGPYELLRRVEKMTSLHRAANHIGMSYSKAWRLIQTLEERLGFSLLELKVGGQSGDIATKLQPIENSKGHRILAYFIPIDYVMQGMIAHTGEEWNRRDFSGTKYSCGKRMGHCVNADVLEEGLSLRETP
jgi:molybdate transport repressor ModE-like protein